MESLAAASQVRRALHEMAGTDKVRRAIKDPGSAVSSGKDISSTPLEPTQSAPEDETASKELTTAELAKCGLH